MNKVRMDLVHECLNNLSNVVDAMNTLRKGMGVPLTVSEGYMKAFMVLHQEAVETLNVMRKALPES